MSVMYATREQVAQSPEVLESAHANRMIDSKIRAASRSAEGFLHRRFYPEQRTIRVDWPNNSHSPSWEVDLGDQEMVSASAVTSGGVVITSNVLLRRWDDLAEPPYQRLAIDLTSDAAFSAGNSWQRSLSIAGVFGYSDTSTSLAGALLSGGINSSVAVCTLTPSSGYYTVGVGALILIGTERLMLIDRQMVTTAQTIGGTITDRQADRTVVCAGAATFAIGETILVDAERMRIVDIAGTSLIVTRAIDGTVLAAHTSGATIYAPRQFIVLRGALGSTAAAHSNADPVYVHEYPALLNELVIAESVVLLAQSAGAYARTIGSGAGTREAAGLGLDDIRERAWRELGRKERLGAV